MSGYRCVNFNDLCRLCSTPGSNTTNIFADEQLQKKIVECLPIVLNDKDKLPKVICSQCLEYVNVFSDFRNACSTAQKMLESCLNSTKLRNGGQVYIKDELPTKKVLKPVQNPSPTKLIPNLCNIVSTSPVKQPQQVLKKNIISSNQQDFLSSIIQAAGIQTSDDASESNSFSFVQSQPTTSIQSTPQYTLTLDGNSLKTGQIQYKIENTAMQSQQIIMKNSATESNVTQTINTDNLLKLNAKKNVVIKKVEEPKDKKPKFNLILQTSPQKSKIAPLTLSPSSKTNTTPSKTQQFQIQNIDKILQQAGGQSTTKQLVVPIMVRNDGQIVQQTLATPEKPQMKSPNQIAYVQMKIAPNADGQFTLTPAQPQHQQLQQLSLSLSPQQMQQLNIQSQNQPTNIQQQYTVTQVSEPLQEQLQESSIQNEVQTQTMKNESQIDNDDDDYIDSYEADDYYMEEGDSDEKTESKKVKSSKTKKEKHDYSFDEGPELEKEQLDMAKKQLDQLVNLNSKKSDAENVEKNPELNLTVCDVCKKVFKKKEFLMQHLKSHIGLRPFKCDEPTCNKSFSRKEHLLRHIVSHTGKKMFTCDVCKKLFSRKDNLNKHRRIHPESGQQSFRHTCPQCNKQFAHKAQLAKHLQNCDGKFGDESVKIKDEKQTKQPIEIKKFKPKVDKKSELAKKVTVLPQNSISTSIAATPTVSTSQGVVQQPQQTQILTFVQAPQQMKMKNETQPQQIILSMSQAQAMLQQHQQQQKTVYTFPQNLILSDGTTFMTTTSNPNEVVGNFKYDNQ